MSHTCLCLLGRSWYLAPEISKFYVGLISRNTDQERKPEIVMLVMVVMVVVEDLWQKEIGG